MPEILKYKEIPSVEVRRFMSPYEDEIIYIIKTGFNDLYMSLHEDAHEMSLGTVFTGRKEEIEKQYNITL